jgi:predicted RNA-binding protein
MCLVTAYLNKGGEEPILKDIAHMRFDGDSVAMETLFGEEKVIPGRVLEVDFSSSKVILEQYHAPTIEGDSNKGDKA